MKRTVDHKMVATQAFEGEHVPMYRVFGFEEVGETDPFLLLDYFECKNPIDSSFPWHPHRGIEMITYLKKGRLSYADSLGSDLDLNEGDIQFVRAGSGIMHQEALRLTETGLQGFHLWINMPGEEKMSKPDSEYIQKNEVETLVHSGQSVKVLAGQYGHKKSAFMNVRDDLRLLDVSLEGNERFVLKTDPTHSVVLVVYEGMIRVADEDGVYSPMTALTLDMGDVVSIEALSDSSFLLIEGKKIKEPIAWKGSIVMRTREEIYEAYSDIKKGRFIK